MKKIIDEAVRLLKDYPEMKYYEAIEKAKEMYEKSPQDGNPKRDNLIDNRNLIISERMD